MKISRVKPETIEPLLAVSAWKHRQLVDAQSKILRFALQLSDFTSTGFSPADFAEDELAHGDDRQGIASNAWNALRAAEIIERLPLNFNSPKRGIFGGRIRNGNPSAKGRWTAVYRLTSRPLAEAWLDCNSPGWRIKDRSADITQFDLAFDKARPIGCVADGDTAKK